MFTIRFIQLASFGWAAWSILVGLSVGLLLVIGRVEGWLRPDVAGRVALTLPALPTLQAEALRQAQRQGASAFALCPEPPTLPPAAPLAAAFSAATYPYKP
jgi:hypothetical protein